MRYSPAISVVNQQEALFYALTMPDDNTSSSGGNRTIAEMAQQYAIYSAAMWISKYYVPVLVPVGLIGNTLSFLVGLYMCKIS